MLVDNATTVGDDASRVGETTSDAVVADSGSAPAEAAPATALDAVNAAADRLSKADSSPVTDQTGQPPAGVVNPSGQQPPRPEDEGIRNLRTAYEGYKGKVGWAENLNKADVDGAMSLIAEMRADPVAFFRQLQADLTGHPEYSKLLDSGRAPAEEPEPGPDLYTTDAAGNRIEMYSAKRQKEWREWNNKQQTQQFEQRLSPLQSWHQNAQRDEQRRQIIEGARTTTTEVLTEMRQMPHFAGKDNEAKIADYLGKIPQAVKQKVGAIAALHMAYNTYLKNDVFPSIDAKAEARIRADFNKRAAAGNGSVKPGSSQQGSTGKPALNNQRDLAAHMEALSRQAAVGQS